jgi:hypothetical protein
MIRVVVAEPGKPAEVQMIEPTLASFQKLVNGYIQILHVPYRGVTYDVVIDEEARVKYSPDNLGCPQPNRWIGGEDILGPIVVTRFEEEDDETKYLSLTEEEAKELCGVLDMCPALDARDVRANSFSITTFEDGS